MQNNENQMKSFSFSCSALSFATSKSGHQYRGITSASTSAPTSPNYSQITQMNETTNSINKGTTFIPSRARITKGNCTNDLPQRIGGSTLSMIHYQPNQFNEHNDNDAYGKVKPLDIIITSMELDDDNDETMSVNSPSCISVNPPSLIGGGMSFDNCESSKYCNDLNSYLVDNADCNQILNMLNIILSHYSDDIDFNIDFDNKRIDGLVFISNHAVYFIIYIWEEYDKDNKDETHCCFEFRRQSGDSLASAKFWSQIKGLFDKMQKNEYEYEYEYGMESNEILDMNEMEQFDFISLDLKMDEMKHMDDMTDNNDDDGLIESELNDLTECLKENDLFVVDELNHLYECMKTNEKMCRQVLCHDALMKELMNAQLLNEDICVVRMCLLILEQLTKIDENEDYCMIKNVNKFELIKHINLLFKKDQRELIKKCVIRVLSNLVNKNWNGLDINQDTKKQVVENIEKYEGECTKSMIYNEMIENITQRLMN